MEQLYDDINALLSVAELPAIPLKDKEKIIHLIRYMELNKMKTEVSVPHLSATYLYLRNSSDMSRFECLLYAQSAVKAEDSYGRLQFILRGTPVPESCYQTLSSIAGTKLQSSPMKF